MIITQAVPKPSIFLSNPRHEVGAVLFDMDGVLVDSIPLHIVAWNLALREHGLRPIDRTTYLTMLGRTNLDMITKYLALQNMALPLSNRKEIIDTKERSFRTKIAEHIRSTPGVIHWLEFLKENQIRCSVASSGEMANIVLVLESLHISDYFTSIVSGAHLPASKPDPAIFRLAAGSLGVEPERCLVIEDAPAGIRAACAAGMLCCAIATTFPLDDLRQADILLENLAHVAPEVLFSGS